MSAALERLEFAPPTPPGMLRAFGVAIVAHLFLMAALTWGVNWRHTAEPVTVEAELWAAVPVQAAPKLVQAPPPAVVEPKPEPIVPKADIVTERDKKPEVKPLPKSEPPKPDPKLEAKRKAEDDAKRMEEQRQENLKRMAGLAGASGGATATGSALQSAAPSASYEGRVQARVYPNIVYPDADALSGSIVADVEVRTAPDGTIVGEPRVVKSSGVKAWDEAVVRAVKKTEVLPRDVDGRVPSPLIIGFRPRK